MVDTLMIGRVGENEVAAVGIANQFFFLFNLIGNGAAMGCSIFISQYWGQKDTASIKKVMGFGLTVNVVISLLFTATALLAPEFIVRLFSRSEEVVPLSKDYLVIVCLSYLFTGISYMLANALRSVGSAYLPMLVSLFAVLTNTGPVSYTHLNVFDRIGKEWMLITAGKPEKYNTMTASWGGRVEHGG